MHSIGGLVVKLAVATSRYQVSDDFGQPRVRFPADAVNDSSLERILLPQLILLARCYSGADCHEIGILEVVFPCRQVIAGRKFDRRI